MPAIGNIVLADGQTTPVNRTFEPLTAQMGETPAEFWEKSAGALVGYRTLKVLFRRSKTGGANKVIMRISSPTLETVSGSSSNGYTPAATKAYATDCDIVFTLPDRCTLQDRKDILAFAKSLLANSTVASVIQDQATIY